MSKSLNNFYTLADLVNKSVDPLAFRLLVLQSHYRKPVNFSLDNAKAAQSRLAHWRDIAALRHQTHEGTDASLEMDPSPAAIGAIKEALADDLNTPEALRIIDETFSFIESHGIAKINRHTLIELLEAIDQMLGLDLLGTTPDISDEQKRMIIERERARDDKDWAKSDELRDLLKGEGTELLDTSGGTIWKYRSS